MFDQAIPVPLRNQYVSLSPPCIATTAEVYLEEVRQVCTSDRTWPDAIRLGDKPATLAYGWCEPFRMGMCVWTFQAIQREARARLL